MCKGCHSRSGELSGVIIQYRYFDVRYVADSSISRRTYDIDTWQTAVERVYTMMKVMRTNPLMAHLGGVYAWLHVWKVLRTFSLENWPVHSQTSRAADRRERTTARVLRFRNGVGVPSTVINTPARPLICKIPISKNFGTLMYKEILIYTTDKGFAICKVYIRPLSGKSRSTDRCDHASWGSIRPTFRSSAGYIHYNY